MVIRMIYICVCVFFVLFCLKGLKTGGSRHNMKYLNYVIKGIPFCTMKLYAHLDNYY